MPETPLTFRYMRFWIETGAQKANMPLSNETIQALDALDRALDESPQVTLRLEPGQMVWCNNHVLAHNRNKYEDLAGFPKRHMCRIWIKF